MIIFKQNEERHFVYLTDSPENGKVWLNLHTYHHTPFRPRDLHEGPVYQTDNFDHLANIKDYLRETLNFGWITRNGQFWGCCSTGHEKIANIFFGLDRYDAEKEGWIQIAGNEWVFPGFDHDKNMRINKAQELTLLEIGRSPDNPRFKHPDIEFKDVYPEGHPLTALPGKIVRLYRTSGPAPQPPGL